MRDEHSLRQPHRQRAALEKLAIGLVDHRDRRPVHLFQSPPKLEVQRLLALLDGVVRKLGQLVIAEDEVNAGGILGLQRRQILEDRVRHAAAGLRIGRAAVADLLEHQMAAGVLVQRGQAGKRLKFCRCPCKSPVTMTSTASSGLSSTRLPCRPGVCRLASVAKRKVVNMCSTKLREATMISPRKLRLFYPFYMRIGGV